VERRAAGGEWERYEEAAAKLGRAVVAYATAFLLWLFLIAIFVPAASAPSSEQILPIVALIFLAGIAVEVYWGTVNLIDFLSLASPSRVTRFLALELIVLLDSLLLATPLHFISPVLGGACIVVAAVAAVLILVTHTEAALELVFNRWRRGAKGAGAEEASANPAAGGSQ